MWLNVFLLIVLGVSAVFGQNQFGGPLKVAVVVQPPFVEKTTTGADVQYRGYCIDLLNYLKDIIGFTYEIYEVPDGSYGQINNFGRWDGMMSQLITGEADIGLGGLHVTAERENFVDFTVPFYDLVGSTILMKKVEIEDPKSQSRLFKVLSIFTCEIWGYIAAAYFATCIFIWIYDRISACMWTPKDDRSGSVTCGRVFYLILGPVTPPGRSIGMRLIGAVWWICALIVVPCFAAYLSRGTNYGFTPLMHPISSVDDLARQYKIKYSAVRGSETETFFRRNAEMEERIYDIVRTQMTNGPISQQEIAQITAASGVELPEKYTNMWRYMQEAGMVSNMEEAKERVLASPNAEEGYAFIGDATDIRYAELTDCRFQQVGSEFGRTPLAIAVQQGSPLKDQISSAILKLLNQRELEHLKEKWWNQNPNKKECPSMWEPEGDTARAVYNVRGLFVIIAIAIVLSALILMVDSCCAARIRKSSYGRKGSDNEAEVTGYTNYNYGK